MTLPHPRTHSYSSQLSAFRPSVRPSVPACFQVNIAQFHPIPGNGIVYGTKRGKVKVFYRHKYEPETETEIVLETEIETETEMNAGGGGGGGGSGTQIDTQSTGVRSAIKR